MTDVAKIVAGLTDAQKQALLLAAPCRGGKYWHPFQKAAFNPRCPNDMAISKNGVLTPVGLAVRAYLENSNAE
jgi:hypothetical protein